MKEPQPEDADGFRSAWAESQQRWGATLTRATNLDIELDEVLALRAERTRTVDRVLTAGSG